MAMERIVLLAIPANGGFLDLAQYDDPKNGGNGDGIIDARDGIWPLLRLWVDLDHNGISTPNEIFPLEEMGVNIISLDYHDDRWTDPFGNLFRYRARINPDDPDASHVGRTIFDIFFITEQ